MQGRRRATAANLHSLALLIQFAKVLNLKFFEWMVFNMFPKLHLSADATLILSLSFPGIVMAQAKSKAPRIVLRRYFYES